MLLFRSGVPARSRRRRGLLIGLLAAAVVFAVAYLVAEPEAARATGYILTATATVVAMANGGLQLLDRWASRPSAQPGQPEFDSAATESCPQETGSSDATHDRAEGKSR